MGLLRKVSAAAAGVIILTPAFASSLSIGPVGLDLNGDVRAGAIALTNDATDPLTVQIRIFRWSQVDGKDVLSPTRDVLVSPPAATIPPAANYTIRVMRVAPHPVAAAESYRLLIDELPKPTAAGDRPKGVSMMLRTSLPVFFTPADAKPHLAWKLWTDAAGAHLQGTNDGQRHVKLSNLVIATPDGSLSDGKGLAGYVLPGATQRFDFPANAASAAVLARLTIGSTVTVTASNDRSDVKDDVRVSAP